QRKNRVTIKIDLDAGLAIEHIDSPYHAINIDQSNRTYKITLSNDISLANRDFVLRWRPHPSDAPRAAHFKQIIENDIYSMIMLLPPETDQAITLKREMIYVIDTSGSMGGQSIRQAKSALELALRRLTPHDRFNIIQFNSYTSRLFTSSKPVNPANLDKAIRYINKLHADGGTEMATAINTALDNQEHKDYLRQVIFITDGSIGNEQTLFELIKNKLGKSRLFTVGIGSAPNSYFMRRAASFGKGSYTYIGKLNEVQTQMDTLFSKIEKPVLKDIAIDWLTNTSIEVWPANINDLYQGEPLLITTKSKSLPDKIKITGEINKQHWENELKLNGGKIYQGISILWARNKIASLMEFKRDAEFESIKKTIIDTALTHHLVSQYTSLVAVDVTPIRSKDKQLDSKAIPTHLPAGWNFNKVFGQPFPQTATHSELFLLLGSILFIIAFIMRVIPRFNFRIYT
ncbi:MAG: marine proteobacterial sortase target protein, partial [Pseudomonadota bacterium]